MGNEFRWQAESSAIWTIIIGILMNVGGIEHMDRMSATREKMKFAISREIN